MFVRAELPDDATAAQKAKFAAGEGGALAPVLCIKFDRRCAAPDDDCAASGLAGERRPMTSVLRISVQYMQISETQTIAYSSMQAPERMPVKSCSAPHMIGSTKSPP